MKVKDLLKYIKTSQPMRISYNGEIFTPTYGDIVNKYSECYVEQVFTEDRDFLALRVSDSPV
jgi:hypothetical protein